MFHGRAGEERIVLEEGEKRRRDEETQRAGSTVPPSNERCISSGCLESVGRSDDGCDRFGLESESSNSHNASTVVICW